MQEMLFIRTEMVADGFLHRPANLSRKPYPGGGRRHPDAILLIQGGHGFEVLEEVERIEVKQGPYVGEEDKTRFEGLRNGD